MKYTALVSSIVLALTLTACGGSDDQNNNNIENPAPEQPDPGVPEAGAKVLLEENFAKLSSLPSGWAVSASNPGKASIENQQLIIDGRANSTTPTIVMLPESLQTQSNYRIEVEFSYENPVNASRWGSIIYRAASAASSPAYFPYYQFAVRSDATAANGTEFARKNTDNSWSVEDKAPFSEKIDSSKTYKATIIVYGNRVQQYLNDVLLEDVELPADSVQGGIGLSAAGLIMKVKNVKVSEQLTALPALPQSTAVQAPNTQVALAPTIIQKMTSKITLENNAGSQVFYTLDEQLNMLDTAGNAVALAQYLADAKRNTIPVLKIKDEATITALKELAKTADVSDIAVMSDNAELLRKARTEVPMLRSVLDLRASKKLSSADVLNVSQQVNNAMAKIVIVPASLLNREDVSSLQKYLITVWGESAGTSAEEAAGALVTGVNGVITNNASMFNDVLNLLPANTLLRKPLVVGHRGVPSLEDENTLEGARKAVSLGADAVENDIYITKDNHLVIMHDSTVDRTTTGKGNIEDMTLAEVQKLVTKNKGYRVPTLAEYFTEFKNNKNVMHFIELKSANEKLIPQLKAEIDQYGAADQVVTISFDSNQIARMKDQLPTVSTGYLTSSVPAYANVLRNVRKVLEDVQNNSSTYNPAHGNVTPAFLEAAKHRGITVWPWTVNDENRFKALYIAGTYGITTDYSQFASAYVTEIQSASAAQATAGQPFTLPVTLTPRIGANYSALANRYTVLAGSPAYVVNSDNSITFSQAGTAVVLPGYNYKMDNTYSYNLFAKPVKVTIQ